MRIVDYLRIFSSVAYEKIPKKDGMKLEDKSKKYILITYGKDNSDYKLYNSI